MQIEKIYTTKVWADEIFYNSQTIADVTFTAPAGTVFAAGATILGTATVAVVSTEPHVDLITGTVTADVEFMVQEELTAQVGAAPDPLVDFPLEYAFRFSETLSFQKLTFPPGTTDTNLQIQVFRFTGTVTIDDIVMEEDASEGSFTNIVNTMTKLKVTEDIQAFVTLGSQPYVQTSDVVVPD
ncbi:hypothetical protein CLNEO_16570 [Anaerotignum neopropionicum]|uniref:SipL SPOCS domain-containing protein n=1 Tax=Anaerotignum neopropionicum TaxID=36847 RepID=A0A136WF49_9FIRM|nr:hypothetical protein [Anaerotignum neopropionicum]KXL53114.1 hypothetical protein CLNEO_16570 [Anaerotignum neopropionicum]